MSTNTGHVRVGHCSPTIGWSYLPQCDVSLTMSINILLWCILAVPLEKDWISS